MAGAWIAGVGKGLRLLGWAAVIAAPLVTHAAIATGGPAPWAAPLAMAEVVVLAVLGLRRVAGWRRAAGGMAAAALLAMLAVRLFQPGWAGQAGLIAASGASHAFIYGSLLLLFGQSLRPGRTDLITGVASRLRTLTPAMMAYTRNVTKAWCVFFALQLIGSAVLLALAPHRVWSLLVNVLDGPSVVVMFGCEYGLRRWRFRDHRHISPMETFRTFARSRAAGP